MKFDREKHGVPSGIKDPDNESWICNCYLAFAGYQTGPAIYGFTEGVPPLFSDEGAKQDGTMFVRLNGWAIIPAEEYEDLCRRAEAFGEK